MSRDRISVVTMGSGITTTTTSEVHRPNGAKASFQANGTTSTGAGAATVKIQGSLDNSIWIDLGTITLTLATTESGDGFAINAPWEYVRANVTAISGTDASVDVYMACEVV
jgi:hypothetical protein